MSQSVALPSHRATSTNPGRIAHTTVLVALATALVVLGLSFAASGPGVRSAGAISMDPPEYPRPALPTEWRWTPEPVPFEHMYPTRPSYRSRSSAGLDWIRPNGR